MESSRPRLGRDANFISVGSNPAKKRESSRKSATVPVSGAVSNIIRIIDLLGRFASCAVHGVFEYGSAVDSARGFSLDVTVPLQSCVGRGLKSLGGAPVSAEMPLEEVVQKHLWAECDGGVP